MVSDPELSPTGRAAVEYARMGYGVIPLKPGEKEPGSRNGVLDWTDDEDSLVRAFTDAPTMNVGLCTGMLDVPEGHGGTAPEFGLLVIDVDNHDVDGMATLKAWEAEKCAELPDTVTQSTPTGGTHLVYYTTRRISGFSNPAKGIDVKAQHGYIVVEPSVHPNGGTYEFTTSFDDMAPAWANDLVYRLVDEMRPSKGVGASGGEWQRFELPDTVNRGERDDTMYRYACSLRAKSTPQAEAESLCMAANRERFNPPLKGNTVMQKVRSAYKNPEGRSAAFEPTGVSGAEDPAIIDGTSALAVAPTSRKAAKVSDETVEGDLECIAHHAALSKGLRQNRQDQRIWVVAPCIRGAQFKEPHAITEGEMSLAFSMLEHDCGIRKFEKFKLALQAWGSRDGNSFDPWLDLLDELVPMVVPSEGGTISVSWDKGRTWEQETPRRGWLFIRYLGAPMDEYTREVDTLLNRQLVARTFHPGCKADSMPVLNGAQGIGKSVLVSKLALDNRFFLEGMTDFKREDVRRMIPKIVVEVAELDNMGRRDMNTVKAFITRRTDTDRRPYAADSTDYPRRAILVGTTNDGVFLTDQTGNRRFLPVECQRDANTTDPGLWDGTVDRDVLIWWGEGVSEYKRLGEDAFMRLLKLPDEVMAQAMAAQESHTQEDYTLATIQEWLDGEGHDYDRVNVKMVMVKAMGYDNRAFSQAGGFEKSKVRRALDQCRGLKRLDGKQRVSGYGTSLAWGRVAE